MSWYHFKALTFKNWVLWRRRLGTSLCEILFPIFIFSVLAYFKVSIGSEDKAAESFIDDARYVRGDSANAVTFDFDEGDSFVFCQQYISAGQDWIIALAPQNDITEALADKFAEHPNLQGASVVYFEDNDDVEDYVTSDDYEDEPKLCFAVVFDEIDGNFYDYRIRFNQTYSVEDDEPVGDYVDIFDLSTYSMTDETITNPKPEFQEEYFESGFIQIQNYVDNYVLEGLVGSGYIAAGFVPQKFDDYLEDDFLEGIADVLPFLIILCYVVPVCRMTSQIVEEKEYRLKEMMMIMGLSSRMYWLSWISQYFWIYAVITLGATFIMGTQLFENSDLFIIFLIFLLFSLSCMGYSALISVLFSRTKSAILVGLMFFLALFFVYFGVNDPRLDENTKIAASVIPTVALGLGLLTVTELEQAQMGVQWDNLSSSYLNYKVEYTLIFLTIDIILFFALAAYLENVWPQEWGVKRPWNFLCTKKYWIDEAEAPDDFKEDVEYDENSVELVPEEIAKQRAEKRAVLVRGLTKQYPEGTKAVDNLDLEMYEGEIFALLGHNGAGKTTTISMLTGLISCTSGDARFQDLYLSKDLNKIRKNLGLCPQQNILWTELSVDEHLYLFSVFKGETDKKTIYDDIDDKVKAIALQKKRDKRVSTLSGGQKRKLQLAIALIGKSKFVLLDEPTAGMDLTARRLMWDMLQNNTQQRIIILTTHYMQEADVLANRIAILSHGRLRCWGTSQFLKKKYGVGYILTCVKDNDIDSEAHTNEVTRFIQNTIPDALLTTDVHAELSYQLPFESAPLFRDLFENLDKALADLNLRSYAISATTLEEVFIRVARGDAELKRAEEKPLEEEAEEGQLISTKRETDGLTNRHLFALLKKRYFSTIRDYKVLISELLVPLALVTAGLVFMTISDVFKDVDPQVLLISEYDTPQNLLYPESTGYVEDLMAYIDDLEDTDVTAVDSTTLEEFDEAVFDERGEVEDEIYRMGSYYFYNMDEGANEYEPVIFHNQTAFQSVGVFYQFISNSILQQIDNSVDIRVSNHPLPITEEIKNVSGTGDGILGCLTFALAFSFIPASIIAYLVKERETNVKFQHTISGVSLWAYWVTNYLWDTVISFAVAFLAALIVLAFSVRAYVDPIDSWWATLLLFVFFGLAAVPFTYCLSFCFRSYSNAQSITIIFFFVTGAIFPIALYVCYLFDSTRDFSKVSQWIFRVMPSFALGNGIILIGSANLISDLDDEPDPYNAFDLHSAGGSILMLGIFALIYPILLLLLEWRESNPSLRQWTTIKESPPAFGPSDPYYDEDVEEEKNRAMNTDPSEVQVNVKEVRKVFKPVFGERLVAVEETSFNVNKGSCFALLGVNGAGKTTTFKMLTGEYTTSHGDAYLGGYSVTSQLDQARLNIGYCPQFDALTEKLTCEEHIKFYCEIKGINRDLIERLVNDLLEDLDIKDYRSVNAGSLSGGNKRKLSVAIALIGDPTVVFLDEPTAGMDPETRKKLWKTLGNIKKRDSAVVLTTHSMEEAEALCDRMAIMVAGRFRCIGSPTELRNKFGQGYELELKVVQPTKDEVKEASRAVKGIVGETSFVEDRHLEECLNALDATSFIELLNDKKSGGVVYSAIKTDHKVAISTLVNWVLIEKKGDKIFKFLQEYFVTVTTAEHYYALYKFRLEKQEDRSLGFLFNLVEDNKETLQIEEYAVSQTSLDQIFTSFAIQGELEQEST